MAEVHEAKRKRAEKRGQKRKRKGNKVLGDQTRVENCPWRIDIGEQKATRRRGPVTPPKRPFLYDQKKHPSQ